ncbi:MAG: response regulator [Parcubacteria group bacterium]|jgi:two-component system phosphate regulon response regulator PhoB
MAKKILIIEDEASLRMALEEKFNGEGFAVLTADNGEDGLVLAQQHIPDLILLDIILPKMNGFDVLSRLAKDDATKEIDVMILTNLSETGKVGEIVRKGVSEYLVKADWTLEEISEKVRNKLAD